MLLGLNHIGQQLFETFGIIFLSSIGFFILENANAKIKPV